MKCKYCGAELLAGEQFCYLCGKTAETEPVKRHCGYCGAELKAEAAFCWKCGKAAPVPYRTDTAKASNESAGSEAIKQTEAQDRSGEKDLLKARTEALVKAAQAGDGDSFTELYQLFYQKVYALAKTTVKSDADAEDVLQTTFIKAWNNLGKLKNTAAFSTWIQRITLNQCYSLLRKRHIDISIDEDDEDSEPIQLESDLMLPEVYAERSDLRTRLSKIIRELSTVQQQTITLYYYDGLPVENIAWIMDCGVNTVKSRLFLARKSIKTEIEEQERKSGQKFYGITGLGLVPFGKLFMGQVEVASLSETAAAELLKSIVAQIGVVALKDAAGGSAAATASKAAAKGASKVAETAARSAAKAGAKAAAGAGARTAARTAAVSVTRKVITGILAATLATGAVTGGTLAAVHAVKNRQDDRAETHAASVSSGDVFSNPHSNGVIDPMDPLEDPEATLFPTDMKPHLTENERAAYQAYLELLEKEKVGIDNYIWQRGYATEGDEANIPLNEETRARPVALCDVYGDDLPELIYIGDADEGQYEGWWGYLNDFPVNLHIVTYQDGRLVTLYEEAWDGWGDSYTAYHLFQIKGSKELYATSSNGDLSSWDYVYRFREGKDGRLQPYQVCLYLYDPDEEWVKNTEQEEFYYSEEGHEITPEEYHSILRSLDEKTVTILTYSYFHIQEFMDTVDRHGSIGMTAGEAIVYLQELLGQDGVPEGQVSDVRLFNAYAAYREYLIPRMTGIENYVWQHCDWECFYEVDERTGRMTLLKEPWTDDARVIPRSVVFYDVYGDPVPELIYVGDVDSPNISSVSTLNVLTYEGGRLVSLYSGEWDHPEYEESVSAHALLVRPDKMLVFYRGEGSTFDSLDRYEEFVLGEDGKLHREFALKRIYDEYENVEGDGSPVVEKYYGKDGTPISKAEYEALFSQVAPKDSTLLFDRYSYADFAMTAQEAVDWLADRLTASLTTIDYPKELSTRFYCGSGVGASGDWFEIHSDGTITGESYDWNGGETGPGYDGVYYNYSAFSCKFRDVKKINAYTYVFTVYDVVPRFENGREEIKDRVRYIYSGACPFREGMRVTMYAKGAPVEAIPGELREMYEMAAARSVYVTMPACVMVYGSGYHGCFEE